MAPGAVGIIKDLGLPPCGGGDVNGPNGVGALADSDTGAGPRVTPIYRCSFLGCTAVGTFLYTRFCGSYTVLSGPSPANFLTLLTMS